MNLPAVILLTRDGCVNAPALCKCLDEALRTLGLPPDYQVINLASLPATDARVGYPTPTVLIGDRDLYGMPEPAPPFPEPS